MSDDATVLRAKSRTGTGGSGEPAPTPRVLKSRFVLDEKLGSGGMGTVYRAKDLRKVEARDRFPYVAIKVLNSDVREHPEAFIALEREASKSQQLAHPNIVSIYDFDKDGNLPFITMELLQGRELADLLRAYPNGLPDDLAWPVIEGLCQGLAYAHQNGVVHADFKPGNVFVNSQNVAKVLDFGIARAVQVRTDHRDDEDTVFDPARMAALTPVYASLEMIRGDNPEPRDDLYSLGVVIYMILTGHHPYGRLSADEAQKQGLTPERPKQISRRQWAGLASALSFYRQARPASVEELQSALFGRSQWASKAAVGIAAGLALFMGSFAVIEGSQIEDVKQEVRQTTLLDAQAARISGLLLEPGGGDEWLAEIDREMRRLASIDGEGVYLSPLEQQLSALLVDELRRQPGLTRAEALQSLAAAQGLTDVETAAGAQLDQAIQAELARIQIMIDTAPDELAEQGIEQLLQLDRRVSQWPEPRSLAGEIQAAGEALGQRALTLAEAGDIGEANSVLVLAERLAPQAERLEVLHGIAEADAQRRLELQRAQAIERERAEMRNALEGSCLRLSLPQQLPSHRFAATRRDADRRIAECVEQLARVDQNLARDLQRQAVLAFGELPRVAAIRLDPCVSQDVSACADRLASGTGPELVVLKDAEGAPKFAVSQEVSGADIAPFCAVAEVDCPQGELPVTGLSTEVVEAFASWLSAQTGYTYRLPSAAEWSEIAASGECRTGFRLGRRLARTLSGRPNEAGLHHVHGNAAELIQGPDGYLVVGRGGDCTAGETLAEQVLDQDVGFRLLRELS